MFKLKKILFPIEFSQRDEAAAPFVLSMALRYHARVVAFHALQPPPPFYAGMNVVYPQTYDFTGALDDLRAELYKFAEARFPKVETECVVESGEPAATITQYGCSRGVDLIAMPTHGYGRFRRALLGSVTAKVLHDSTIPVWTSAHTPEPSHRAHPQPRRILCAVDMKAESLLTLRTAIALARDAGAVVETVHVPAQTVSPDAAQLFLRDLLTQAAAVEGMDVEEIVRITAAVSEGEGGDVADTVRDLAVRNRIDLVVIGRGAIRNGLGRLYANCYDIIRESPCPVLSV